MKGGKGYKRKRATAMLDGYVLWYSSDCFFLGMFEYCSYAKEGLNIRLLDGHTYMLPFPYLFPPHKLSQIVFVYMQFDTYPHVLFRSDSEMDETSSEDSRQPKRTYRGRLQGLVGRVLCMDMEDRKKSFSVPVLVTQVNADDMELKTKDHVLVKSFKDSKL